MRALLLLVALGVFLAATASALLAVRPQADAVEPAVRRPRPVRDLPPPLSPLGRLESAIAARRWEEAAGLLADPAVADSPRIVQLRDQVRRGAQRDAAGVIESKLLLGALSAWGASDAQRVSLKVLAADVPYTLPEKRRADLLVLAPRKLDTDTVEALADEMRLLRIEGLEVNAAGRPLTELTGAQWRYLGGSAIDRLPPAAFAACPQLDILDLSARKEVINEVFAAIAGRASLRILRLPTAQPLGPASQRALATLTGLEELSGSAIGLTGATIADLAATRLRTLRLENQLAPDAFAALGRIAGLRRLTCSVAAGPDLAPLAALAELDELTLAVAASGVAPDWLRFVRVKTLRLSQAGIGDGHAEAIARMPLLDRIELSATSLSDAGLLRLAANPCLRAIDLGANPGITGSSLPALLRSPGLRELRLANDRIPPAALIACPDPGRLERFTWGGSVSAELLEHLTAWPGMVRVSVAGKLDAELKKRLDEANERRVQVPPDLPVAPAIGF